MAAADFFEYRIGGHRIKKVSGMPGNASRGLPLGSGDRMNIVAGSLKRGEYRPSNVTISPGQNDRFQAR